jgi:uncharacterized protein YjbI with pentapeptide repeats
MADLDHVKLLCAGPTAWNEQRARSDFTPDLTHIDVRRVDLRGAQLQATNFDGSRLTNVDMANAELSGARLNGIIATSCRLDGANMQTAEFKGADLVSVSLRGARLDQIISFDLKIRHSDMREVSLQGADLQFSHFYNSDLRGAKLDNAILDRLVTKRILIEEPRIAELEALGCSTDLINQPTQSEWSDWAQFQVRSSDDDFGVIICNGQTYWYSEGRWDFFVSHATTDKESVVLPLVTALRQRGQRIWYDDLEIKPADDLQTVINRGIDSSLFGIVVVSKSFFGRRWTEAEIKALTRRRVFLVLNGVSAEELATIRPALAGRYAVPFQLGVEKVADKLVEAIRRPPGEC